MSILTAIGNYGLSTDRIRACAGRKGYTEEQAEEKRKELEGKQSKPVEFYACGFCRKLHIELDSITAK
jgi:hypothetical protein